MATTTQSGQTILVVDDNAMSASVIERRLTKDGHQVLSASSGENALRLVAEHAVSLIYLDVVMPGMDGLQVLKALKSDDKTSDIPVVVISGLDDSDAADACMTAGAIDFLHKPVMAKTLQGVTSDVLGTGQTKGAEDGAPVETAIEDAPVLDDAVFSQLMSDYGADTARGFVERFAELTPVLIAQLRESVGKNDVNETARAAHMIKGSARTLGLSQLAAVCRDIERTSRSGLSGDVQGLIASLDDYYAAASAALDKA